MKYFVVSDIHSYLAPLQKSLSIAGYDKDDEEHTLIVLGDVFDRGPDTLGVYKFLRSIPNDRLILIRGNHEDLYLELLTKEFPEGHDSSNGTVDTFLQIAKVNIEEFNRLDYKFQVAAWQKVLEKVKKSQVTSWIKSKKWYNYFEVENYIFVHSFIPLHNLNPFSDVYSQYGHYTLEYFPLWREDATKEEWQDARWGCPWMLYQFGYFDTEAYHNKVLVCGHWHTAEFHKVFDNKEDNYEIYFSENLIGLDGCVHLTYRQNVLIIDGENVYDRYKRNLRNFVESTGTDYFISSDSNYSMWGKVWCSGECNNRTCLRNITYNIPKHKYASIAELTQTCKDKK